MHAFFTLLRRELGSYFASLTGYVIIAAATFLTGLSFVMMLRKLGQTPSPVPVTEMFTTVFFWIIVLLTAPIITMRTFALEKYSGTYETLMTAPVRDGHVVLAKFGAALIFYLVMWLPLLAGMAIIRHFTNDHSAPDWGTLGGTYLGMLLVGAFFLALGCLASALTRNQAVAAMTGCVLCTSLFFSGLMATQFAAMPGWVAQGLAAVALFDQMQDFARGVVDTRAVIFLTSGTVFALLLTLRVVESRRWK